MEDLLKNGPYEIKELTREQKQNLIDGLLGCADDEEDTWDLDEPWYVSNNPMLDQVFDNRDEDFWQKGEEYPYPYVILIGGKTVENQYESITKDSANRLGIFLSR
jgi:hypothetical protein